MEEDREGGERGETEGGEGGGRARGGRGGEQSGRQGMQGGAKQGGGWHGRAQGWKEIQVEGGDVNGSATPSCLSQKSERKRNPSDESL